MQKISHGEYFVEDVMLKSTLKHIRLTTTCEKFRKSKSSVTSLKLLAFAHLLHDVHVMVKICFSKFRMNVGLD